MKIFEFHQFSKKKVIVRKIFSQKQNKNEID